MNGYIPAPESAAALLGDNSAAVIRLLADRFMRLNPRAPYVWRTFDETGIQADSKGGYHFDFDARFPSAACGDRAVAIGELYCPQPKGSRFVLRCHNPVQVLLNGEPIGTGEGTSKKRAEQDAARNALEQMGQ